MTKVLPLAILLLGGCHPARNAPDTVTPGEDRGLNDAAAKLDANAMSANATNTEDTP